MASHDEYDMVVAIDFGTTYSGYAFQMTSLYNPDDPTKNILCPQSWNDGRPQLVSLKTPTCLLLDRNHDIDTFGYQAEDRYADLCLDGDNKDFFYFRRFKMELHDKKKLTKTITLNDETGKPLPAIIVFGRSIEALKNHLFKILEERKIDAESQRIKWVLTVPAIWDETAKQFMREAAKEGKIPTKDLSIALEPEAASLYCQYLPVEKFSFGNETKFSDARPGTTYMIVDLGGGTADITVHEKVSRNKLKEVDRASGGPWGGTAVDGAFITMISQIIGGTADITVHEKVSRNKLKEVDRASGGPWGGTAVDGAFITMISQIIGGPVFSTFMKNCKFDYLDFMREFESVKRTISATSSDDVKMKLPASLNETCKGVVKKEFKDLVKIAKMDKKITFVGDKMKMNPDLVRSLFKKATDKIIKHMKDITEKTEAGKKITLILMVGGFSESPFVQDLVKAEFHDKKGRKVLVPNEAGISVLNGAVVYGRQPENITERVLRYTYGVEVTPPFDATKHRTDKKYKDKDGNERCDNVFSKFVTTGTHVQRGKIIEEKYWTTVSFQNAVIFKIFFSEANDPKYIDETGSRYLGELTIDVQKPSERKRYVMVKFEFGDTEIHMSALEEDCTRASTVTLKMLE